MLDKLPSDVFSEISKYISSIDILSLAIVNKRCNEVSKKLQVKEITPTDLDKMIPPPPKKYYKKKFRVPKFREFFARFNLVEKITVMDVGKYNQTISFPPLPKLKALHVLSTKLDWIDFENRCEQDFPCLKLLEIKKLSVPLPNLTYNYFVKKYNLNDTGDRTIEEKDYKAQVKGRLVSITIYHKEAFFNSFGYFNYFVAHPCLDLQGANPTFQKLYDKIELRNNTTQYRL